MVLCIHFFCSEINLVGGGATAGAPTSYSVVITNRNNHLYNVGFALEGSAASQFCF
jgi:hypothetical protein